MTALRSAVLSLAGWLSFAAAAGGQPVDFTAQIEPIFRTYCYSCHQGQAAQAGLRLDSRDAALAGGASGPAIVPGNAKASLLLTRLIATDRQLRMPLGFSPLPPDRIELIRLWIDQGAPWAGPPAVTSAQTAAERKHWAYVKPVRPSLPEVKKKAWVRNSIDYYVLARLESEGLAPSPEAARETLIRRVSLDLIGLPPTVHEVDEFVADPRADAYERLVDRLLASPHYGERWARPWLDLARYADTHGFEKDRRRSIWKYRDWVIQALNQDMPFDRFTVEQIAGDMLPEPTTEQLIATGFNRNTMFNEEGGVDKDEAHWENLVDRVSTTATVWLGSTLACAQCHDHKFDPFTQKEFYQFLAFFNSGENTIRDYGDTSQKYIEPELDLPTPEQQARRDEIRRDIESLEQRLKTVTPELSRAQAEWERTVAGAGAAWSTLAALKATSTGGSTLTPARDGAVLVSGHNPDTDVYVVEARTEVGGIAALRLEALPHESLPRGGPGRDTYGNFFLTEVAIEAASGTGQFETIEIEKAVADNGRINDERTGHLWGIDASREDERLPRQIVLVAARPFGSGPTLLRIRLRQASMFGRQGIGHFRLSVTDNADPEAIVRISHRLRPVLALDAGRRTQEQARELSEYYLSIAPSLETAREDLRALRKELAGLGIASTLILRDAASFERPSAQLRIRGSFLSPGELVYANVPAVLHPFPDSEMPNRLGLARWLVSGENPLTARVVVNRFWEQIFGRGLVETSEDFGAQSEPPSHPELLDWLAVEFMDRGWSMKAIHRLMVTSAAYRQSSRVTPELQERDPYNRLLARGPRFRVEAEMVRDVALAASGLLSPKIGGPSVFPPQPDGIWDLPYNDDEWVVSEGEDRYRRGLYTFIRRTAPYPSLLAFDATSREVCTVRRPRTNTPLQALTTLNDPAFFEAAQALAKRVASEPDERARAELAFRLSVARKPKSEELDRILEWVERERRFFEDRAAEAGKIGGGGPELAAWTMVANVLLNLDETLTKE